MNCSICQHPRQAEMIIDYARTMSFRVTATRFGVGYRSLHRHIERCIYSIMEEYEQKEYEKAFSETAELLKRYFRATSERKRLRSIIKRNIEVTWGRKSWNKSSKTLKPPNITE